MTDRLRQRVASDGVQDGNDDDDDDDGLSVAGQGRGGSSGSGLRGHVRNGR
jgi:hypothetical protein